MAWYNKYWILFRESILRMNVKHNLVIQLNFAVDEFYSVIDLKWEYSELIKLYKHLNKKISPNTYGTQNSNTYDYAANAFDIDSRNESKGQCS